MKSKINVLLYMIRWKVRAFLFYFTHPFFLFEFYVLNRHNDRQDFRILGIKLVYNKNREDLYALDESGGMIMGHKHKYWGETYNVLLKTKKLKENFHVNYVGKTGVVAHFDEFFYYWRNERGLILPMKSKRMFNHVDSEKVLPYKKEHGKEIGELIHSLDLENCKLAFTMIKALENK